MFLNYVVFFSFKISKAILGNNFPKIHFEMHHQLFPFPLWCEKTKPNTEGTHLFIYFYTRLQTLLVFGVGVIRLLFFFSSSTWKLRVDILWFNVPRGSYFLKLRMRFLFVWEWTGQHWWVSHQILTKSKTIGHIIYVVFHPKSQIWSIMYDLRNSNTVSFNYGVVTHLEFK